MFDCGAEICKFEPNSNHRLKNYVHPVVNGYRRGEIKAKKRSRPGPNLHTPTAYKSWRLWDTFTLPFIPMRMEPLYMVGCATGFKWGGWIFIQPVFWSFVINVFVPGFEYIYMRATDEANGLTSRKHAYIILTPLNPNFI